MPVQRFLGRDGDFLPCGESPGFVNLTYLFSLGTAEGEGLVGL